MDEIPFITNGKLFELSDCDKNFKVVFCCVLWRSRPGVHLSPDLSSSGNLPAHIIRKHNRQLIKFDSLRKNRSRKRTAEGSVSSHCSPPPKKYQLSNQLPCTQHQKCQIHTTPHFEKYNARNTEADQKSKSSLKMHLMHLQGMQCFRNVSWKIKNLFSYLL